MVDLNTDQNMDFFCYVSCVNRTAVLQLITIFVLHDASKKRGTQCSKDEEKLICIKVHYIT